MTHIAADASTLALRFAATHAAELRRHVRGARSGRDPEHVHDMRLALRRLRGAASVGKKAGVRLLSDRLTRELKWLARALGTSRDWDVFAGKTWQEMASDAPEPRSSITNVEAAIARQREAAQRRLRRTLATQRFGKLMVELGEAIEKGLKNAPKPSTRAHAGRIAHRVLAKRAQRVRNRAEDIRRLTPETRHALRIEAKKLRYAAELIAGLYKRRETRAYLRRLIGLQSALGELNDLSVGESTVEALASKIGTRDRAVLRALWRRYVEAREQRLQKRLATAWARFLRAEPFW